MQVMQYIKDKGDKKTGNMNILKAFDEDIKRIFSVYNTDIGLDPQLKEGKNAIIIAHSLGSVIAYDYIMGFRKDCKLPPNITIRCFITIGSPIPIFTSAMGHPDNDLVLPKNVERWVNIMSPRDAFVRYMKPYFRNIPIQEHYVSTGLFPIQAHNGYFNDKKTASIIANEVLTTLNT